MRSVTLIACGAVVAAMALGAVDASGGTAHIGCPGKDIRFRAADGTKLVAHRYGTGKTFVVLAHMADGDLCQWQDEARRLASQGYSALAFDFRGAGESQVRSGGAAQRIERDVAAAVKLSRTLGAKKVLLVGASAGGWAVLVAAAQAKPSVQGVVAISTPAQYRGDAVAAVRTLKAPVLYVVSTDEGLSEDAQALHDATGAGAKRLEILSGSAHGTEILDPILNRSGYKAARTLIESFLRKR